MRKRGQAIFLYGRRGADWTLDDYRVQGLSADGWPQDKPIKAKRRKGGNRRLSGRYGTHEDYERIRRIARQAKEMKDV